MGKTDSIMMFKQLNDSLLLSNFSQLNPVADDTTEFAAVTECSPEPIVVNVNGENAILGIPISAIVSIIIFMLGWLVTRAYKRIDEFQKRERYRNAVLKWIDLMEPAEKKLIESVNNLSKAILTSDDMQPVAFPMPNTIPDKIKDLSVESMMDAFGRGDDNESRNRHLYNIISQFDYLTKMNVEILKEYKRYNNRSISLIKEWNQVFESFAAKVELAQNKETKKAFNQWIEQLEMKPNNIDIHIKYLDIIDSLVSEANYFVLEMKRIILQIREDQKGFAKLFEDMAKRMHESLDVLKESAAFFREHPEKKGWLCKQMCG